MIGIAVLTLSTVLGTSPAPPPNFVPGEVMLKFVSGSEAHATVVKASERTPTELQALAPVIKDLEERTDIPLQAKQLTGGNWILLSVDIDKLNDRIVHLLRTQEYIEDVHVGPEVIREHIGFTPSRKVVVKFSPDSAESQSVAKQIGAASKVVPPTVISQLETDCGRPLKGELTTEAEVVLEVDLRALTLALEERLKALPDIEATQLNYVMTIS